MYGLATVYAHTKK